MKGQLETTTTSLRGRLLASLVTTIALGTLAAGLLVGELSTTAVLMICVVVASTLAAFIGVIVYLDCRLDRFTAAMDDRFLDLFLREAARRVHDDRLH